MQQFYDFDAPEKKKHSPMGRRPPNLLIIGSLKLSLMLKIE
jgi:hypothetical protein